MKRILLLGAADNHKMTPWSMSILQGRLLLATVATAHQAVCQGMRHEIGAQGLIPLDVLVGALSMSIPSLNLATMIDFHVLTQ